MDIQSFTVITLTLADVAGNIDIGQKMHFHPGNTVAPAGLAATTFDVKAETTWLVSARPRFLRAGVNFAYGCKQASIGSRVRAGRASDWALINIDDLVEELKTATGFIFSGVKTAAINFYRREFIQGLIDQCRFTRS